MPYCVNCGAQNREGARFCESCGKPIAQVVSGAQGAAPPPPPPTPTPQAFQQPVARAKAKSSAAGLLLAGAGMYAVGALLCLMAGNMMGLVTGGAMAAGIYLAGYEPLEKGKLSSAYTGVAVCAGAGLVLGFFNLQIGAGPASIFNFLAAAVLGLALTQIKK